MKILARQLTVDLYNCKNSKLNDKEAIESTLANIARENNFKVLHAYAAPIAKDHFVAMLLCQEGHIGVHVYTDLRYVAIDLFICDTEAEPEIIFRALRKFFQPDKVRTTFLKRGDFGSNKDARPKIKNRIAPVRRIRNTGAKVVRILARRNKG
ncbi:MAG TPA: adenosylmethionine decarboxylase [Selenomonas sp.]|jgi:S-adenosylmethionine decarboxylase|nr:adenosylmethionine decarboxylase [Selenomonadaceae bacterium]HBT80173.1 adenosylmethionine decarboxylase [Selenomonas sp.]